MDRVLYPYPTRAFSNPVLGAPAGDAGRTTSLLLERSGYVISRELP